MATTTNYGWTTPDDTALVKDGASAIRSLGTAVDTTTKNLNPSTTLGDIEYRSSTANTNTRLGIGSTGQVLTVAGGVPSWATPAGASLQTATFNDTKSSGTNGGTFTNGAWRTRDLNTSQFNGITSASLSSNQISLPAGTYYVVATAPAFYTNEHQLRVQNITDSTTAILGSTTGTGQQILNQVQATLSGSFTIAGTKTFELQHRAADTKADNGFGAAISWGDNIYAIISIAKVA